jgi:hypothetical protein
MVIGYNRNETVVTQKMCGEDVSLHIPSTIDSISVSIASSSWADDASITE